MIWIISPASTAVVARQLRGAHRARNATAAAAGIREVTPPQ